MSAKKTQVKLYKINTNLFPNKTANQIPAEIISRANAGVVGARKKFTEQTLKEVIVIPAGFILEVFHALKDGKPGWVDAWTDVLDDSTHMITDKNSMSSFIAFISHGTNLYALTGGQGNFSVSNYVENFFGLDVIDRLLDSTLDKGIGEASKSGVTGNVKSELRTFYDLTDGLSQDSFETFFRQIKSKINVTTASEYFERFYPKHDYTSFFQGGNYFLIRKSIPVTDVFNLVLAIERVFAERESSGHNKLIPIGSVKSAKIDHVRILNDALMQELFSNQDNPERLDDYYFAPKSIPEHQIDGSVFAVAENSRSIDDTNSYEEIPKVSDYVETLLNVGGTRRTFRNLLDFKGAIGSYKVLWKHIEDDRYTAIETFESINGVMNFGGKSYLRFEGSWYVMRQNFKEIIDAEFTALVTNSQMVINLPDFLTEWTDGDENDYNYSYLGNNSVMVAHKAIKGDAAASFMDRYIEYSDLIHLDRGVPKLLHVKKTCNSDMRVASAQVHMCAQKLNQNNREEFLREYYRLILSRDQTNTQNNKLTEDEFVEICSNEQINVSLVISDDRVLADDQNLSLSGKFYFVKMFKDMDSLRFGDRFRVYNV